MRTRPNMHIRTVYIPDAAVRRVNVLAEREGLPATTIFRALIETGLAAYEAEHGPLPIDGVSLFARPPRASLTVPADAAA